MVDETGDRSPGRRRRNRPNAQVMVYFAVSGGRIKIGSSRNVSARLRQIAAHFTEPLELIGTIPGSIALERAAHAMLKEHRGRGEWFQDCFAVRQAISEILVDPACLDAFKPIPKEKPPFIPEPVKRENALKARLMLFTSMWPEDHVGELAAMSGASRELAERWISGAEEWPEVVRLAVSALFWRYMSAGEIEHFK